MTGKTIKSVIKSHSQKLMSLPGVIGVAQGECECQPCIKVYIIGKTEELIYQIPSALEGYTVVVEESGGFQALDA
jgi:hypothetical protein